MGTRSGEIAEHIEFERGQLGRNVDELEARVKDTFDWRSQVKERPIPMVGIAFGGGLLLSALARGRRHSASRRVGNNESRTEQSPQVRFQTHQASETFETIKGALIGVIAGGLKSFLQQAIPGFAEHYSQTEQRTRAGRPLSNAEAASTVRETR